MSSFWSRNISLSIFGESHGPAIGIVIDNLPPGEYIDVEKLRQFMARRAPKKDGTTTPRGEKDLPQIMSGLLNDRTTGVPLCAFIQNTDTRSKDYSNLARLPRPGHADYTGAMRYRGFNDVRGGGHFSGRLTAPLCFAGAVCGQILERRGIYTGAHIASVHGISDDAFSRTKVTKEDILKLMEIKMGRILKFNSDKADELIARMKEDIAEIDDHLAHIVDYTVNWYQMLKNKYGKNFPRRTELRNFDTIEAAKVVEANEKLYINREEGFIGTALKKDEFVANCSDIDDVIVFFRDGKYIVTPVADKKFVGKNILYVNVFKKNDKRTIYNVTYRDGKEGTTYIKRFAVTSVVRDREYDVTQGTPDSRITYFSANPNGEAEIIKVTLKPNPRVRRIIFERDFSEISIKGRQAQGVILTRLPVHKIALKQKGGSTLGGRKVWFDRDILRLNYDGRGEYLGEFQSDDTILVVLNNGDFYTSNFDLSNHYEDNVSIVEKFDSNKVWTAALYDADQQNYPYLKRFCFEGSNRKQNYLGENKNNRLILLTDEFYPRLEVIFGGHDSFREPLEIDADEFIAVKGFKAKGKRITTYTVETINELEPTRFPEPEQEPQEEASEEPENLDPDSDKSEGDIIDEITGQMKLF